MKLTRYLILVCLLCFLFARPAMAQRIVTISGGTVTANVTDSQDFLVNLTANVTGVTLTTTATPATGYIVSMKFVQDATGSRTVAFGGNISSSCAVNSTANSVTICRWQYTASTNLWTDSGGGGISPNSPGAITSSPGPVFNVANYTGAFHNSREVLSCTASGSPNKITCAAGSNFTAADVGLRVNCAANLLGIQLAVGTTISGIQSTTVALLSAVPTGGSVATCTLGTPDDTAIAAAFAAALAQSTSGNGQGQGNKSVNTASPVIYFPAGGWMSCAAGPIFNFSTGKKGFKIMGDVFDGTHMYNCDNVPTMAQFGYWVSNTNMTGLLIENITFNGGFIPVATGGFGYALYNTAYTEMRNVHVAQGGFGGGGGGGIFSQGNLNLFNVTVDTATGIGINCNSCGGEWHQTSSSNNGAGNWVVQNVIDNNSGNGLHIWGGLGDEGGVANLFNVINSQGLWLHGASLFGTNSGNCINIDGTSWVHWLGGICGTFGNDSNNSGPVVAAGGVLEADHLRAISTGTGKCYNISGKFNDNGSNSCESMFPIASGTSTGTAAVLTVTTLGANANTNCTVGDALFVTGAGIAGYNGYYPAGATSGITAVTATTISYTTAGSNLGALSAGGQAYCRNLQSYAGTLPNAMLNIPTTNTCYVTGTFGATVTGAPMCNARIPSATSISRITAASTTVTACTVAPVVTISDGTASITLTITTAKSQWDSSVDASSGVGTTIFKPNGTLQVTNTAGTCTTPPTNFSVSYNPTPILSN